MMKKRKFKEKKGTFFFLVLFLCVRVIAVQNTQPHTGLRSGPGKKKEEPGELDRTKVDPARRSRASQKMTVSLSKNDHCVLKEQARQEEYMGYIDPVEISKMYRKAGAYSCSCPPTCVVSLQ